MNAKGQPKRNYIKMPSAKNVFKFERLVEN